MRTETSLPVPVIAIGASAGGLDPIGTFLSAMPVDSGLAFVVIQHLDPASRSMLPDLLTKHTSMRVLPATDGVALRPNEVYAIQPGTHLSISEGKLHTSPTELSTGARFPIDAFLRSLAVEAGNRAVGIVMSGTGTDGALGLKTLKEGGGLAVVQDPQEAQHDGMPRFAMLTARPDYVLRVRDMPAVLLRFVAHNYVKTGRPAAAAEAGDATATPALAAFVELLRTRTEQDFGAYKTGTLQRRIDRRMALHGIESRAEYLAMLRQSPAEVDALAKDLLINVTGFFRDPEAFARLAGELPGLIARHEDGEPMRLWVAGCSTGEEAYSLGMLLLEQMEAAGRRLGMQIFATDVDDEALQVARAGVYPENIQADVSAARLRRFFTREDGHFKVVQELRDAVIFSHHDLLTDPPFSRLDLVSCRNLLIYLTPAAQRRVLMVLHFALQDHGILFLGTADSIGATSGLFEPADEKLRVYRRRRPERAVRIGLAMTPRGPAAGSPSEGTRTVTSRPLPLPDLVQRLMLEIYAPAAVVVNRQMAPVYYFGAADRYLKVVAGEPAQDVLAMAREGLRPSLREVIARAFRSKRRAAAKGVWYKRNGSDGRVTIEASRLATENGQSVLLVFIDEPSAPADATRAARGKSASAERTRIRQELTDTRRELNRTIFDLRQVNEELRAKNQEAMSLNEEFVSTNEELESSKEELQSLNEELNTVNIQLRQSLGQQQQASTDLNNLLNSSPVATILLDPQLQIKAFNPRMKELFSLIEADIGRPLADLLPKFADPDLAADVGAARSNGTSSEKEVHAESGIWYIRSVMPYLTETGNVAGAVITFSDVTGLKRAELTAAAARLYAQTIVNTVREPLLVVNTALQVVSANTAFQSAFHVTQAELDGRGLSELPHPLFAQAALAEMLHQIQQNPEGSAHLELQIEPPDGAYQVWQVTGRMFRAPALGRQLILLTLADITETRRIILQQLQMMIDALPGTFLAINGDRRIRFASSAIESLFGYRTEELIGQRVEMLVPTEVRARHAVLHDRFVADPKMRRMGSSLDISGQTKDGRIIPLDIGLSPLATADGPLVIAAIHDLRGQKKDEERLREAKAAADRANQAKSRFLAATSHDLRQPLQTIGLMHGLLRKRIGDAEALGVLAKLDKTVASMSALLDTLLDINRIESGGITPRFTVFPVASKLTRMFDEFAPLATSKGLTFRVVRSSARIRSDRQQLARMLGNLLSNAIKYTDHGRILLGCRRRGRDLRIEVWDTGIGIPPENLKTVFDEFYRVDKTDSSRFGLGLGLYIVRRLGEILGHAVEVRSTRGRGTVFAITVPMAEPSAAAEPAQPAAIDPSQPVLLVIEDDATQLDTLRTILELEGYVVLTARTGAEALRQLHGPSRIRPDVVIADYNLPGGMTGLDTIERMRSEMDGPIPVLIVSGDRAAPALRAIETSGHRVFTKPINVEDLVAAVAALVKATKPQWQPKPQPQRGVAPDAHTAAAGVPALAVIDDEAEVRDALRMSLAAEGYTVATYGSSEAFLADPDPGRFAGLVVDLTLPGIDGLALQARLRAERSEAPIIFVTGSGDLPKAVQAMREGAADFLQKPVSNQELSESVARALASGRQAAADRAEQSDVASRLASLTARERQVMEGMLRGEMSKGIAAELGISLRTTEHHRQSVMRKMGVKSLAMLVRMVPAPDSR